MYKPSPHDIVLVEQYKNYYPATKKTIFTLVPNVDITFPITIKPETQRCKLNFISFLMAAMNGVLIAAG